jgi:hypothetical protein
VTLLDGIVIDQRIEPSAFTSGKLQNVPAQTVQRHVARISRSVENPGRVSPQIGDNLPRVRANAAGREAHQFHLR